MQNLTMPRLRLDRLPAEPISGRLDAPDAAGAAPRRRRKPELTATTRQAREVRLVTKRLIAIASIIDPWLAGDSPNLDILTTGAGANPSDAIEHLARRFGPFALTFVSFAVGESSLRRLRLLREDGQLTRIEALTDALMLSSPKAASAASLRQTADVFAVTACHAKCFVLWPAEELQPAFTVSGSVNLTENPRVEIIQVSRERTVAKFYRDSIRALIAQHQLAPEAKA